MRVYTACEAQSRFATEAQRHREHFGISVSQWLCGAFLGVSHPTAVLLGIAIRLDRNVSP